MYISTEILLKKLHPNFMTFDKVKCHKGLKCYCVLWESQTSLLIQLSLCHTMLPLHSLIDYSVLPRNLTSVCVCVCVFFTAFPCRLWAAVSARGGEALPISADGEPELQHPGGCCWGSAKPQRWTVDCESWVGESTTHSNLLSDF